MNHKRQFSNNERFLKGFIIGNYNVEETIGEGTFGKVKLGTHLITKEKVAVKILEKKKIVDKETNERVKREIIFLKKLKHTNIIQLLEIIENPQAIYLIMEYAKHGEFFNYIVKQTRLNEMEASMFFAQIINGIKYIHENNIAHRDLKPENLLLSDNRLIKIIDFGLSNSFQGNLLLKTPCGSPCYAAPEMLLGKKYDGVKIDIWSCGIILYAMVCGFLPFEDEDNTKLYQQILDCNLEFPFNHTEECIDLIKRLLCRDPEKRITLPMIQKHSFYLEGQKILEEMRFESPFNENIICNEIVSKMINLGYKKESIYKNIQKNEFNDISSTYFLLKSQMKAQKSSSHKELQSSILYTMPNSIQNTFNNGLMINDKICLKTEVNDSKHNNVEINNSFESGKYANEICITEMIVNDKFNNEEKDFFKEESINPIKKSSQKLKIKEVSIDINKSKNNSYKNMLFKYQKKNNNITTLNNYTEENQQEINYIKTDNNINSHKRFTPDLSNHKKQSSLRNISYKKPISLYYNQYSKNIKNKVNVSHSKNFSIDSTKKHIKNNSIKNSISMNSTKYAYIKLNTNSKDLTKNFNDRSMNKYLNFQSDLRGPKLIKGSHKMSSQSPNKIINNLAPNKNQSENKSIKSSFIKYLSYSSKYKHKTSSDNKLPTNMISKVNYNLAKPPVNKGNSLFLNKIFSESNSMKINKKKEPIVKAPLSDKINTSHKNLLMNHIFQNHKIPSKNDLKKSNRIPTPPPNFKSCLVLDSSFNIKDKINKICISNKVLIKEAENNVYKCEKNKNTFCIEVGRSGENGMKMIKFYHLFGLQEITKNVIKSFMLNFGA